MDHLCKKSLYSNFHELIFEEGKWYKEDIPSFIAGYIKCHSILIKSDSHRFFTLYDSEYIEHFDSRQTIRELEIDKILNQINI